MVISNNEVSQRKSSKIITIVSIISIIVILVFFAIIMFTGDINIKYEESSFSIESSFWNNLTVKYSDIDRIEYRVSDNIGKRTLGFENTLLLAGNFKNDEFDKYIRYSYKGSNTCVVLFLKDKTLVINGIDNESTKMIYDELMIRK